MKEPLALVFTLAALGAVGCSADTGLLDSIGRGDAGPSARDAIATDTGIWPDAARPDARRPDTGDSDDPDATTTIPDAGFEDSGVADSGFAPDATPVPDAGCAGPATTIHFAGIFTLVEDDQAITGGLISPGDPFAGSYTFDPTTPDSNADPTVGDYWHTTSCYGMSLSFGGLTIHTNPMNVDYVVEFVNRAEGDAMVMHSYNNSGLILANGRQLDVDILSWQLDAIATNVLANDALIATPPILTQWSQHFGLTFVLTPGGIRSDAFVRGVVEAVF